MGDNKAARKIRGAFPGRNMRGGALRALGVAVLACAVLLTGLLAAGSASAQTTNADGSETLWESTLTVGDITYGGDAATGFRTGTGTGTGGTLSDTDFVYGSDTFEFDTIARFTADSSFAIVFVGCCSVLPDDHNTWILQYGTSQFAFKNLIARVFPGTYTASTAPNWAKDDVVALKLVRATAPTAPRNLHAKGVSATQIDLSWSAPSQTGGANITGYKIEVSNTGTGGWSDLVASQTSRTYSHTVTSGVTRYYRVSAINAIGTSPVSDVASATRGSR